MTIGALIRAVPPPAAPFDAFDGPWDLIEAQLGTELPPDYKDFIRLYGYGTFLQFLAVHVPYSWSPYIQLVSEARAVSAMFASDPYFAHAMWPAPGGLLTCGKTDFGDYLFWRTEGPPQDWRIVIWDRGMQELEFLDCDLTGLLAGLVTGTLDPEAFPEDMLPCDPPFAPGSWDSRGLGDLRSNYAERPSSRPKPDFGPLRARFSFPWLRTY